MVPRSRSHLVKKWVATAISYTSDQPQEKTLVMRSVFYLWIYAVNLFHFCYELF
jgi:hypothetical protein